MPIVFCLFDHLITAQRNLVGWLDGDGHEVGILICKTYKFIHSYQDSREKIAKVSDYVIMDKGENGFLVVYEKKVTSE